MKKEFLSFQDKQFMKERKKLLEGALKQRFYIITGRPGSGKTRALIKVIEQL